MAENERTFDDVLADIEEWVTPRGVPGVAAAVWHGGRIVATHEAGQARDGVTVTPETLFALASVTKPFAAATVISLVEEGVIALDDRAGAYLPAFADAPADDPADPDSERGTVTVRQLLCHVSGLPEDIAGRDDRLVARPGFDTLTDALVNLPLTTRPGEVLRYSNAGYAALARLAETAGGDAFWPMTRSRVLDPLGLDDIVFRPSGPELDRVAHLAGAANPGTDHESYNSAYWRDLAIPWGGLFGTPAAAVRFAASFLPDTGAFPDHPLGPAAIAAMTTDQVHGVPGGVESGKVWWERAAWGLGWEIKGTKTNHWTGQTTSPETFCHFGQAGTLVWADPARDVALAVLANRTVTRMWGFILPRWARLSDAVVAVVDG
ncbi:MAG: beta-lactamase family protein [Chloroflexia bacterium]|nr:beta-lactamase family protein [Chloroflexia bacterium]